MASLSGTPSQGIPCVGVGTVVRAVSFPMMTVSFRYFARCLCHKLTFRRGGISSDGNASLTRVEPLKHLIQLDKSCRQQTLDMGQAAISDKQ